MERAELARIIGARGRAAAPCAAIIEERDPARFQEAFGAAVASGGAVFVADPSWGAVEREAFSRLAEAGTGLRESAGWLRLPTGGSGGGMKLARHDERTLAAAVAGAAAHFGVPRMNAVGVLPLHHVSGLMAWLRCALTGGRYRPWSWADLAVGRWPELPQGDWFLSLVPTQLQRLLDQPAAAEQLRRFRAVFLGGGPAWPYLLDRAAAARLPLAPGYGMTETAAMVASLRPEEFLAGRRGCGLPLPHARVTIDSDGAIVVEGESLFRGYAGAELQSGAWTTGDLGLIDGEGGLRVLGRRDGIIISGGEKIDPVEVESALRSSGQFDDVAVIGLPDPDWGQAVVACFPAGGAAPDLAAVEAGLSASLAAHKRPKRYHAVAEWPRNEQGKLSRAALAARLGTAR